LGRPSSRAACKAVSWLTSTPDRSHPKFFAEKFQRQNAQ
jgi:hypothetical protein